MKFHVRRIIVALATAGLAGGVCAADLLAFYRDAVANDSQFASARAQLEAGREKGPQGRAGLLPDVSLRAGTTYNRIDVKEPNPREASYNSNSYQLRLAQPLFRWQNWISARQGELQVGVAEAQFGAAQSDLILRVAQAYFDVLYAEDVLSSIRALKAAAEQQLQLARVSFEVGTVTITDVNEARSRFDLASAQEIAAASDLEVKRHALRLLTGKETQVLSRLRPGVQLLGPLPADMEQWVRQAEQGNPTLLAQRLTREIARREVERSRGAHLPTVDLVATYGRSHSGGSTSSSSGSESNTGAIGLEFAVPLYQGGGPQSRVREALALSDRAESDLATARRQVGQSTRQAYLGVASGIAQVRGYEAAVISSQSAVESNRLGYEVGVRINIDVLNAQTTLADAQQRLAKARYDTLMSLLRLKAAAGSLSPEDVQQVNDLLEK